MKALNNEQATQCPAREPDQAGRLEQAENVSQATKLLGQLPENQQEVIRLKMQDGLSYREIAEITGLSISNVGFLLHKGIRTIREQFAL